MRLLKEGIIKPGLDQQSQEPDECDKKEISQNLLLYTGGKSISEYLTKD